MDLCHSLSSLFFCCSGGGGGSTEEVHVSHEHDLIDFDTSVSNDLSSDDDSSSSSIGEKKEVEEDDDSYYGSFDDDPVADKDKHEPYALVFMEKARGITRKQTSGQNITYEEGINRLRLYNDAIRITADPTMKKARIKEFEDMRQQFYTESGTCSIEIAEMNRLLKLVHQTRNAIHSSGTSKDKREELRKGLLVVMHDLRNVYKNAMLLTHSKDTRIVIKSLYNSLDSKW